MGQKRLFSFFVLVLLLVWLIPIPYVFAQSNQVQGIVKSAAGKPMEGIVIKVSENSDLQTVTGSDGTFSISASIGDHLKIIQNDQVQRVIPVNKYKLNIKLSYNRREIPVGYGIARSKNEITGAVGMVGSDAFARTMVINPENELFGEIPGLTVLGNGGQPPTATSFYVRGRGTFTDSSPLVLVDGFQRSFSSISPAEIKSVTVLKDAASLAKYGQRGANGVVLVTTKRGEPGKVDVRASYQIAATEATKLPKFVDGPTFARAYNEALQNDGRNPRYSPAEVNAYDSGNSPYLYPNVDWLNETLRDRGVRSKFNASFEGGNENIQYFSTLNFIGDDGLFGPVSQNSDYSTQLKNTQFNIRTNLNVDITDNLLLKLDVAGILVENNRPSGGDGDQEIFNSLYGVPSGVFPVKTPDGNWGGTQIYGNNPLATLTSTGYGQPNSREFFLTAQLERDLDELLSGLTLSATVSYNNYGSFNERKTKQFKYEALSPVSNQSGQIVDTTKTLYGQNTDLNFVDSFGAKRTFLDVLGKADYQTSFEQSSLKATLLFHQSSRVYDGVDEVYRRQNLAGDVHYNFAEKYFFDASASYSGNNFMEPGHRFGIFPAVGAGWMISNEPFLRAADFLNRLKLRASWGILGSDHLPTNDPFVRAYHNADGYWFQGNNNYQGGFAEGQLATPNFTFERSYNSNIGLDATFFNKVDLTADVFYAHRTNILTGTGGTFSEIIGITPPQATTGVVDNKGFEAGLKWHDTIGEVAYSIGGQFSYSKNEIKNMEETYRPYNYLKRTGQPVGQRFGLQATGFFKDEADIANSPEQVFSTVQPGDIKYKDQNGDGVINQYDEVPQGYASRYPQMYFSASMNVKYKGLSVSALVQGTGNYTAFLNTKSVFRPLINNNTISQYYYNHRWTPTTSSSARFPRLTTESNNNNFRNNSVWLVDKSYLKLRTVEVSYQFPLTLINSWKLNSVRIFGRGHNLFSINDVPALDPEQLSADYPALRTYSVGLEIEF